MTDKDYLYLAYDCAAAMSDDPRTQNGAVLVKNDKIIGMGANCFPSDVKLLSERLISPEKYFWMEHAERNAILSAARQGNETNGSILYCPWFACADCARSIIQAGVTKVVGHKQTFEKYGSGSWDKSINIGNQMFKEAGIELIYYDGSFENVEILFNGEKWKP